MIEPYDKRSLSITILYLCIFIHLVISSVVLAQIEEPVPSTPPSDQTRSDDDIDDTPVTTPSPSEEATPVTTPSPSEEATPVTTPSPFETANNGVSGSPKHIGCLEEVTINATPQKVMRGDFSIFNFSVRVKDGSVFGSNIKIAVPRYLGSISLLEDNWVENEDLSKIEIPIKADEINEETLITIIFRADIPLTATPGKYNISSLFHCVYQFNCSSNYIEVMNNLPKISDYHIESKSWLVRSGDNYTCFNQSDLEIYYRAYDRENGSILDCIVAKNNEIINRSIGNSLRIPLENVQSGYYPLNLTVWDGNDRVSRQINLTVLNETYEENAAKEIPNKIIILTLILVFILSILLQNTQTLIWISKISILISASIFVIYFAAYFSISVFTYSLMIYLIFLTFAISFISRLFGNMTPCDLVDPWFLKFIPKLNFNLRGDIKNAYNIYLRGSNLLAIVTFGMMIMMLIIAYSIPLGFFKEDEGTIYNYIFWYYSAIVQLFGTILSIVTMFTIWFLQGKIIPIEKSVYIQKIKDFMFIYIFAIVISVIGLVLGKIPPIMIQSTVTNLPDSLSIFTFETSFLLIIPAMAALYSLVSWIISLHDRTN